MKKKRVWNENKARRWMKKASCIGLVTAMVVGMCGCGKKGVAQDPMLAKQNVYAYEEFELPDLGADDFQIRSIEMLDETNQVMMLVDVYGEEAFTNNLYDTMIVTMGVDGSNPQIVKLDKPVGMPVGVEMNEDALDTQNDADSAAEKKIAAEAAVDMPMVPMPEESVYEYTNFDNYIFSDEDIIYATKNYNKENYSAENYSYINESSVCAWNVKDGSLLWEAYLPKENPDEYVWIAEMFDLPDGSMQILFGGTPAYKVLVSPEGKVSDRKEVKDEKNILSNFSRIMEGKDGIFYITYYNEQDNYMEYIATFDPKTDVIGEGKKLPEALSWSGYSSVIPGVSSDLVFATSSGLYNYNIGDAEITMIMDYVNSDLSSNSFSAMDMVDAEHFVAVYYDRTSNDQRGAYFTKKNPEDIPDKQVLVLAGNYIYSDIKEDVINFNKTSDKYRIVIKEYSQYNTYEDYKAGITMLNNDIIAGNMPDILIVENGMNVGSYINKGLLADVGSLMEKDEELKDVEFLQNVFDAYKVNDKLYYVIPSFSVNTYIGKKAIVGDRNSWTMDEYQALMSSLPEGTSGMGEMTKNSFMYSMMQFCGNEFMDISTGQCKFNSPEFISMLEYANTLPKEINYDEMGEDYWMGYESQYREGRTVLMNSYFNSAYNIRYNINGYFGEDVSFVGFPNSTGNGSVVQANDYYVLSSRSANLDGAWEFVKDYFSEENQDEMQWEIPVRKTSFDKWIAKGMEKSYFEDENGEKQEYEDYYYINGQEFVLPVLTQAQVDQVSAFIQSVDKAGYYNEDVNNIIMEEVESFFSGQKSAIEVADIIQSRVQLFVNENR